VLRYPDGLERTIRYPASAQSEAEADSFVEDTDEDSPGWVICGDNDPGCIMAEDDVESALPGAAPVGTLWSDERSTSLPAARNNHDVEEPQAGVAVQQSSRVGMAASALPDSPAELLRLLNSDAYKRQQQSEAAQIRRSFSLLTECPWAVPRQLSVLALQRPGQEHPAMYTLPATLQRVRCPHILILMSLRACILMSDDIFAGSAPELIASHDTHGKCCLRVFVHAYFCFMLTRPGVLVAACALALLRLLLLCRLLVRFAFTV
jgi:hypothetical protein